MSFQDKAHADTENPPPPAGPTVEGNEPMMYGVAYPDMYYSGMNIEPAGKTIAIDGDTRDLGEYQCYNMCAAGTCTGPHCNCAGFPNSRNTPMD